MVVFDECMEENWKYREGRKNGPLPILGPLSRHRSSAVGRDRKFLVATASGGQRVRQCSRPAHNTRDHVYDRCDMDFVAIEIPLSRQSVQTRLIALTVGAQRA